MDKQKTVAVGMSGGVDSTVTALLLQQQGYNVIGVTFRLWMPEDEADLPDSACCSIDNVRDAKMVCTSLGIPHYVLNYKDIFKQTVVNNFVEAYKCGQTPNPCIDCNKYIKFDHFLNRMIGMDCDYIATGHYAQVVWDKEKGIHRFKKGVSQAKDQSYFLYNITQEQLSKTLMPLGGMDKPAVRAIAEEHGFAASKKPDSQDICFVPDKDYSAFLRDYTNESPEKGDFIDTSGAKLGQHQGIWNYTVGQRKGLGVTFGKPMYVKEIIPATNQVVLCEDGELFSSVLYADDLNWIEFKELEKPLKITAKIRSTAKAVECVVEPDEQGVKVSFDNPQRAITPGQAIVFYDGDYLIGGGTIISAK